MLITIRGGTVLRYAASVVIEMNRNLFVTSVSTKLAPHIIVDF